MFGGVRLLWNYCKTQSSIWNKKRIDQNKLQIDVKDWFLFIEGVLDLFCNDSSVRASVISNFKMISYELNTSIDNIINKKLEKKKYIELLKRIFSLYSYMDAFSVFNNIAPIRKCQEEVEQILGEEYNFDGIVISLVEPHREFVRRKKIDAAIQFIERGSMQVVEQYRLSARMFEYFDEWLYDDFLLTNSEKLKRELVLLIKQYGRAGLYKENKLFELKQDIKSEFEKIKTKICTILDDEVNIIDMCCNFEQFHCIRCEHENTNEEIYFIDIYSFYNNCDIFFSNKDFKRKKNVPDGRIWSTKNGCFFFPRIIDLDNMGCKQQQLNVQRGVYRKVYILGYATWGNQGGTMIISFSDNSCEEIDLYFSDWTSESNYGECIVWKTEFFLNNEKDIYDGKIFSTEYSFNKLEKEITSLKLPENENIHIFAITLSN